MNLTMNSGVEEEEEKEEEERGKKGVNSA